MSRHVARVFTSNSTDHTPLLHPDLPELLASVHLGFILVYSAQRRASLAVLADLLPKLPDVIPKMIVAMGSSDLASSKLVGEGEDLARINDAMFYKNVGPELQSK